MCWVLFGSPDKQILRTILLSVKRQPQAGYSFGGSRTDTKLFLAIRKKLVAWLHSGPARSIIVASWAD